MLSFGLEKINRTFCLTLKPKYVRRYLVRFLFVSEYVICAVFCSLIASAAAILLYFNLEQHHSYFAFSFMITVGFFYGLF